MDLLLTRRPIFDAQDRVAGWSLAYRDAFAAEVSDDRLMLDACLSGTFARAAGHERVFVPVSHDLLRRGALPPVDADRVALVVTAPAARILDPVLVDACQRLHADGAVLALVLGEEPECTDDGAALLKAARYAIVDVTTTTMAAIAPRLAGTTIIARGVVGRTARDACARHGATLFEGHEAAHVVPVEGRDVPIDHMRTFRLMRELRDERTPDAAIEDAFRGDVALTYRLLSIANSAAVSRGGIQSIAHAVRLVGRDALARWLTLLLLSTVAEQGPAQREIARASLVRGRTCELLAGACGVPRAGGSLFVVGVVSLLDALLGVPMPALVARMELADDARRALLAREDFFGAVLSLVEAHEKGEWETLATHAATLGVEPRVVGGVWGAAHGWAGEQMAS